MKVATAIAGLVLAMLGGCQKAGQGDAPTANDAAPAVTTPGLAPPVTPAPQSDAAALSIGQASDATGEIHMDVLSAVRAGGVVTIKTKLTLTGGKTGSRPVPGSSGNGIYLSAADKKYMMLKDDAGKELMSTNYYPTFAQVGSSVTWWAKFPAPAADVKAINFYFNDFEPVENVPLTDR